MKKVEVVAAIIQNQNKYLCCQRPEHKFEYLSEKWEFPGGKIELGESKVEALEREIQEELGLALSNILEVLTVVHQYPHFELTMHAFLAKMAGDKIILHEHKAFQWLEAHDLSNLDWAAADIPIVKYLESKE